MIRFEWSNGPVDLQSFLEPTTLTESVEIQLANVEPGCAYRIEDLLPRRADGITPWEDGFSHNELSFLYWPVSILRDEPYSREALVSNVEFNIHHTRLTSQVHAVRVLTFPKSRLLQSVQDSITFGIFLESNIDTEFDVTTILSGGNVVGFDQRFDHFELGSTYRFDNSNHNADFPIRLIRIGDTGVETLAEPDELGVMTVRFTNPSFVGETVYVQQGNHIDDLRMTSVVRDGSTRRLYKEYPPVPFQELFGDGYQIRVFEFPHVDPTYERYDVFVTMRNANGRYITSHSFTHTVEPQGNYPIPTSVEIQSVIKSTPDNAVAFEYPKGYYAGLVFRAREVSLLDMYRHIIL